MYIADATVAFWHVLLEGAPGSVYNVGVSSPEVTILELAEWIVAAAGEGCRVELAAEKAPTGEGSPMRTCPDISRLQTDFDFRPAFGLDDLIERTLRWLGRRQRL
jgi:nucleoside-diphosphate-sugar epimerase